MAASMRPTILVVEDDENLLAGISDILEMAEYNVLNASSGLDGLHVLKHAPQLPSLIVSDISMPQMDGYAFLDAVRQERAWTEIPFIFLTAMTEKSDVRRGMIAGVDDYLTKPPKIEELLLVIHTKLKRRSELANVRSTQIKEIKRNILTILNHEFRTPLTPVVAYADMVNTNPESLSEEELKMFLSGINMGAKRLRQLVEDFILLIELETGEAQTAYNFRHTLVFDLAGIVAEVATHSMELAAAKGIYLELEQPFPRNLPPFVADTEYLRAAIARLVDNAIKFTDVPGRTIYIGARTDGQHILISVVDQGRGIPADQFDLIFDSFYQINREHYEDQGTGSGLAIVKAIMALHSGSVSVSSEVGVGSTFTLTLPVA